MLAEHDLHVNSVIIAGGHTVLHEVAASGSPEAMKYLIAKGAQVNVTDEYGYTPLDEATLFGKEEIVTLLEQAGATHSEHFIRAAPTASGIRGEQTDERIASLDGASLDGASLDGDLQIPLSALAQPMVGFKYLSVKYLLRSQWSACSSAHIEELLTYHPNQCMTQ